jgi:hypothetical protein
MLQRPVHSDDENRVSNNDVNDIDDDATADGDMKSPSHLVFHCHSSLHRSLCSSATHPE